MAWKAERGDLPEGLGYVLGQFSFRQQHTAAQLPMVNCQLYASEYMCRIWLKQLLNGMIRPLQGQVALAQLNLNRWATVHRQLSGHV